MDIDTKETTTKGKTLAQQNKSAPKKKVKNAKSPFEVLGDLIDGQRRKLQKTVNGKLNKLLIDTLLQAISDVEIGNSEKCIVENIEYLDGYFIFVRGDNTICHFSIKQLPGWRFGIWLEKSPEGKNYTKYSIFTQYERFIDKFKPSASSYMYEAQIVHPEDINAPKVLSQDELSCCLPLSFTNLVNYIYDHPYLAIYKDLTFTDYDVEYVSERYAKKCVRKEIREDIKKHLKEISDEKRERKYMESLIQKVLKVFKLEKCVSIQIDDDEDRSPKVIYTLIFTSGIKVNVIRDIEYTIRCNMFAYYKKHPNLHLIVSQFVDCQIKNKKGDYKFIRC